MSERTVERRINYVQLEEKLDRMADLLASHMSREEQVTIEIKQFIKEYFDALDGKTHRVHHDFVGDEIKDQERADEMWAGIKKSLIEKVLLVCSGAIISYIAVIAFTDLSIRIQTTQPPAYYERLPESKPQIPAVP